MLATDHFVVHSPGSPSEFGPSRDGDVLTTEDIIRFIRRSWRLWLIYLVVSVGIGAALAVFLPKYYTSYATLLLSAPAAAQSGGTDAADTRGYVASQIQVIQSDEVVSRAIDQTRLMEDTEFGWLDEGVRSRIARYVRGQLAFLLGGEESARETTNIRYQTMLRVKRNLSVAQRGFSNAVDVAFTSRNPQLSARLANAIARSYIENQREQRQMVRAAEASELQSRLAELREKAFATHASNESLSDDPESAEEARLRFREQQSTTEVYRSLYNNLLQQPYTGTDVASLIHSARVITAAEPPLRHTWPPVILVMALAAIAGNVGGIGHALIRQATDRSLRTVEEVRRLAAIDRVTGVSRIPRRRWQVLSPCEQCLQEVYSKDSAELHSALSRIAVRLHEERNRHGGFVIGVVSPVAGAGTSTIAVHLARVIRETGQKTLLVDANWRKPLAGQPSLYVEPARDLDGSVTTIPADQEELEVLILRPTEPISELNASLSIVTMLRRLQHECDWVVVDFHSIDQTADIESAMDVISEVLIVLQARRTLSDHVEAMLRIVPKEKIAAAILNRL